jgi:hypothetical protein
VTTVGLDARPTALSDRMLAAWPVVFSFLVVSSLYVWQASKHPTPWLFSDEVEYAQISRAIAEHGKPARRGVEYWGAGLFPWLIAPFWWFDNLHTAYGAVKTFNALAMTAAMFPTYLLARMLMTRPYALLAALGSVIAPSFIYSAMVMQEPVAYLTAATAFLLTARALVAPTRWNVAAVVAVGLVAPFVRDELIVVPAVMVGSLAVRSVCFGKGRDALARASARRRLAVLGGGLVLLALLLAGARVGSGQIRIAFDRPATMLDQALWAWGALTVGLGVLPVVLGLAVVIPAGPQARDRARAAFTSVFAAALVLFTAYVAVKGTYQAATFEPRVSERNLLYLVPLLFVALALFAATRAVRPWALAVAAALTAWAIDSTPLNIGQGLAADAPGLAILSRLDSDYGLGLAGANQLLFGLLAAAVLVGLAPSLLGRRQALAAWIVIGAAVLSIGWGLRAETAAASYSNGFSELFEKGLPQPVGWVDEATGGKPALYLGQKIADPNGVWSMEFWNRSVRRVWSMDGTAPGPGPTLTPSIYATDGRLVGNPGYEYAVADNGISIAGETVAQKGLLRLIRIDQPLRLTQSIAGVFNDGWIGSTGPQDSVSADYNRFDAPRKPGVVYVTLSRKGFCGPPAPGRVLIQVGKLALGQQRDGVLGRVTQKRGWVIDSCGERTFPIETPGGPFHVKVTVTPPFQPATLDPKNFERRYFGAQLGIDFTPPP